MPLLRNICLSVVLLLGGILHAQNPRDAFHNAVRALDAELGYEMQESDCQDLETTGICRVLPALNWINARIYQLENLNKDLPEVLDDSAILRIRQVSLKNREETNSGSRTYYRLVLEEWTCHSDSQAMGLAERMESWKGRYWETLDKTPVNWWRNGRRIYFLRLGGWFVLGQEDKIREVMDRFLK